MVELKGGEEDVEGHTRVAMGREYKRDDATTTDVLVSEQIYHTVVCTLIAMEQKQMQNKANRKHTTKGKKIKNH